MRRRLAALAVALGLAAAPAGAELVHVEAMGSVALGAASKGGAAARQEALEAGIREAVERTGQELVRQAGSVVDPEAVRAAIGDPKGLAARYRILEDRGERAPLLESNPGAEREYVVEVEVEVDRSALQARLQRAGLLGSPAVAPGGSLRIVLEGVDSYPLWIRIRDALGTRGGAVRAVEFGPGRIVAQLGSAEASGSLIARLAAGLGEQFEVQPVGNDGDMLRIAIARRPPPEQAVPELTGAAPVEPADAPAAR